MSGGTGKNENFSGSGRYDHWQEIPIIDCYWCGHMTNDLAGHITICLARPKGIA
jgi:hypothetical protein